MILRQAKRGRTTITIAMDLVDGLISVSKGKKVYWVTDNIDSAMDYFFKLAA